MGRRCYLNLVYFKKVHVDFPGKCPLIVAKRTNIQASRCGHATLIITIDNLHVMVRNY